MVLLLLLGIVIVVYMGWGRLPGMISERLSQKMGVRVTVERVGLGPSKIDIHNLEIANARGYTTLKRAFAADEIAIRAPLFRYTKREIVIEEIKIDNIYLGLEFDNIKGTNGNWTTIMANLEKSGQKPASSKDKSRSVFIKKVILTNINTDVVYISEGRSVKRLKTIPYMELNNISSSGDELSEQLANSVLGQMLKQVFVQQNLNNMIKEFFNPDQGPTDLIKPFRGLFN